MGIQRGKIGFVLLVVLVGGLCGGGEAGANDANNWGCLQIDVRFEGKQLNNSAYIVKHDLYYPGATDGIDPPQGSTQYDTELLLFKQNRSGGFVDVENKKLDQEVSANSSRTGKHVKGFYKGNIQAGSEPNIIVELSWLWAEPYIGKFGDMPLILTKEDSEGNNIDANGYRGDIRAEMDFSGVPDFASIPLGKAPAGTYTENGPYFLHLRVDFDKPLGDLDNDYVVNFKDYAILAERWREEERSIADISGANDIPDNVVDYFDLREVASGWLEEE